MLDCSVMAEHIPIDVPIQVDLGFKGFENEYETVELPHKKPRGAQLTESQKEENRLFSAERVVVEHAFGGMKRYKAAADIYRNRIENFDDHLMVTTAGLWNFYLAAA
ncbi:MAG: transposase [Leptolyngbya foveolarum]|uniref:Transposase n=1 Tax=Leptolyngbya foveolarum TaxID=47253 RepID=A0A2W4THK8_9CYAN|nr:MAG: transposase [Leptolyngbya foveolarum]